MKKRHLFYLSPDGDPGGAGGGNEPSPEEQAALDEAAAREAADGSGSQGDTVPLSELNKVNREAAKYRKELRDTQKRLAELEDKDKSDLDKERESATRASAENRDLKDRLRNLQVQVLAGKVGVIPEAQSDAARLLDWDGIDNPEDEKEVETALRALVKEKPFLLGGVPGGADGGAGGSRETGSDDMNALIRAHAGR